jgi:hypothetical protein
LEDLNSVEKMTSEVEQAVIAYLKVDDDDEVELHTSIMFAITDSMHPLVAYSSKSTHDIMSLLSLLFSMNRKVEKIA